MSEDDTLISKLISETYSDASEKDQPTVVGDLRDYFERKLNEFDFVSMHDYLSQHSLMVSDLAYQEKNHCYRMVHKKSVIDFPSNWSIFKEIRNEDLVFLDQSLDQDYLLDIFSELTGLQCNLALVKENSEVKVIYLPKENSKDHLQWFRGYFEKRSILVQKDAA